VSIGPNSSLSVVLDAGEMVCGYPRFDVQGAETEVRITYAEVLRTAEGNHKTFALGPGVRLEGPYDTCHCDVARHRFHSFQWRSFRFVRLDITAGPAGATIADIGFDETFYPAANATTIATPGQAEAEVQALADISWRTLRCCAHETYMDCPFYEQLQYVGDTRIQALVTYVTTGDPTLPIQALRAFDRSRTYEGLTQSRYPSNELQIIPTFSLIYLLMLDDFRVHVGDMRILRELRPGIAPILGYFARLADGASGLIRSMPYWPFVDWVEGWNTGVPGGEWLCVLNLHHLLALDAAARVEDAAEPGSGKTWRRRANALRKVIAQRYYDPEMGLLRELPLDAGGGDSVSQHAQALGVLGGVLKGARARKALRGVLAAGGAKLPVKPASFYFRFYVAEALAQARMGEEVWPLLAPFREAAANGSTTWPESLGPDARSECHAWGSWPLYFLARHVLGVGPGDGGQGAGVEPLRCSPLDDVSGTVMTGQGAIRVQVRWEKGECRVTREKL
jgi:hypothetical protein